MLCGQHENMKLLQPFTVQDKFHTNNCDHFAAVRDFMAIPGADLLFATIYKGQT